MARELIDEHEHAADWVVTSSLAKMYFYCKCGKRVDMHGRVLHVPTELTGWGVVFWRLMELSLVFAITAVLVVMVFYFLW